MKKIYSTILFVFAFVALNAQTTLTAGDIAIVGYKSVNTNQGAIAFILLKDIDAGTIIDISNRSWLDDQTGFTGAYGVDDVYTWTATNAIPSGTILTLGTGESVTRVTGGASSVVGNTVKVGGGTTAGFNLLSNNTSNGDSVLFFQHSGTFAEPTDGASTGWITGIKTGIDWSEVKANTANAFCAKPTALTGANLTITFPYIASPVSTMQNGVYNGPLLGSASDLRASINNPANWTINSTNLNDGGAHIYKLWSYAESDGTDNGQIGSSGTLSTTSKAAFEFSTYPNPVKDVLHINTKESLQKVEVYDLLGKSVLSVKNVSESIDVSSLSKSIYIVKLTSTNGVSTKKFVKE
jgi:hypothetical protein